MPCLCGFVMDFCPLVYWARRKEGATAFHLVGRKSRKITICWNCTCYHSFIYCLPYVKSLLEEHH